jgi:hypothetical protein
MAMNDWDTCMFAYARYCGNCREQWHYSRSARSRRQTPTTILERVGPIEVAWQIEPEADTTAYAILFAQESPYHKLDIGISDPAEAARLFEGNMHCVEWRQGLDHRPQRPEGTRDHRLIHTNAYIPVYGGVGHTLVGELMSAVRYVKARKRGHHLTCWRFARSKVDVFIKLLDEQEGGWATGKRAFTTWDYKALDKRLGEKGKRLHDMLDWSTPAAMDRGVWRLTREITRLLQMKAQHQGEHIPVAVVERYMSFVRSELGLEA